MFLDIKMIIIVIVASQNKHNATIDESSNRACLLFQETMVLCIFSRSWKTYWNQVKAEQEFVILLLSLICLLQYLNQKCNLRSRQICIPQFAMMSQENRRKNFLMKRRNHPNNQGYWLIRKEETVMLEKFTAPKYSCAKSNLICSEVYMDICRNVIKEKNSS